MKYGRISCGIEVIDINHAVVENGSGMVEFYPVNFLSSLGYCSLRWSQGFVVVRGKIYSAIYGWGIEEENKRYKKETEWKEIILPFKDMLQNFPSKHQDLKAMADNHWGLISEKEEVGGGYLRFYFKKEDGKEYLSIEVRDSSGEYGLEKSREKTVEILQNLFPEWRVFESEDSLAFRKQAGK